MRIRTSEKTFLRLNFVLVLCLLTVPGLFSCSGQGASSGPASTGPAYEKRFTEDPVILTVSLDRKEVTAADRVRLSLHLSAPEQYGIKLPDYTDETNEFSLAETSDPARRIMPGGKLVTSRVYTLEPFLPGEYTIPSLKVTYQDQEGGEFEITTEPIGVEVRSLLTQDSDQPEISDIFPPEAPPVNRFLIFMIVFAAGFFFLALIWLWNRSRNRKKGDSSPPVPAHVQALKALEDLLAEDLLIRGELKLFHSRVSDILRRYIEDRFALRAPERTTEEFLLELGGTDVLHAENKKQLRKFLVLCDQVKFAKYQPLREETSETVDICRQFIGNTKAGEARETGEAAA